MERVVGMVMRLSGCIVLALVIVCAFRYFCLIGRRDRRREGRSLHRRLVLVFFVSFATFLIVCLGANGLRIILFCIRVVTFFTKVRVLCEVFCGGTSVLLLGGVYVLLDMKFVVLYELSISATAERLIVITNMGIITLVMPILVEGVGFLGSLA